MERKTYKEFVSELKIETPKTFTAFADWSYPRIAKASVSFVSKVTDAVAEPASDGQKDKLLIGFLALPFEYQEGLLVAFLDSRNVFLKIHILNSVNDLFSWTLMNKNNIESIVPSDGMHFVTRQEATKRGIIRAFALLEKMQEEKEKPKADE